MVWQSPVAARRIRSERTTALLEQTYANYNLTIDSLFVLDKDDIMVASLASKPSELVLGEDFSFREAAKESRSSHSRSSPHIFKG